MEMPEIHHQINKIVKLFKADANLIAHFLKYHFLLNTSEGFETYKNKLADRKDLIMNNQTMARLINNLLGPRIPVYACFKDTNLTHFGTLHVF